MNHKIGVRREAGEGLRLRRAPAAWYSFTPCLSPSPCVWVGPTGWLLTKRLQQKGRLSLLRSRCVFHQREALNFTLLIPASDCCPSPRTLSSPRPPGAALQLPPLIWNSAPMLLALPFLNITKRKIHRAREGQLMYGSLRTQIKKIHFNRSTAIYFAPTTRWRHSQRC